MEFKDKLKLKLFWISFIRVVLIFIVVMSLISLMMNSSGDIFSANWEGVAETNFNNGKWKLFFGYKVIFSFFYALWTVSQKIK